MLRFAGGLHLSAGQIMVEASLDSGGAARRLKTAIADLYGFDCEFVVVRPAQLRRQARYIVRLIAHGDRLARLVGLLDERGHPKRGLPTELVQAGDDVVTGLWRGAFLARGSLGEPGRSMAIEIACPNAEVALALAATAPPLGIRATARQVRGVHKVFVRDGDSIAALLARLGAHDTLLAWEDRRARREIKASTTRLSNFDDANLRRSIAAAVAVAARIERALEIVGPDAAEHLIETGRLRIAHQQASLEELGQLHDPPVTKDAVAGRLRRLLATADKLAVQRGIPDTQARLQRDSPQES